MTRPRHRVERAIKEAQARIVALDEKIGRLMSLRVDNENYIAECMDELKALEQPK